MIRARRAAVVALFTAYSTGYVFGGFHLSAQTRDRTDEVRQAIVGGTAHSIILFIGDGMGDSEMTLARNYARADAWPSIRCR